MKTKTIDLTISDELLKAPICLNSYTRGNTSYYSHVSNESFKDVLKTLSDRYWVDDRDETPILRDTRDDSELNSSEDLNGDYGYIDFEEFKAGRYEVFPLSDILDDYAPLKAIGAMKRELKKSGKIFWDKEINAAAIKALISADRLYTRDGLEYLGYNIDEELEENEELEIINHDGFIEHIYD